MHMNCKMLCYSSEAENSIHDDQDNLKVRHTLINSHFQPMHVFVSSIFFICIWIIKCFIF